jgi:hypothetical protein
MISHGIYNDTTLETLLFRKNKLVLEVRLLTFAYMCLHLPTFAYILQVTIPPVTIPLVTIPPVTIPQARISSLPQVTILQATTPQATTPQAITPQATTP